MSTSQLSGRAALVTGGDSELGKAIARVLCQKGAHVIISSSDPLRGKAAISEIGCGARFIEADFSDLDSVDNLAHQRPIDILVNNAAYNSQNIDGIQHLTATIVSCMIRHDAGIILNIASTAADAFTAQRLTHEWDHVYRQHPIHIRAVTSCPNSEPDEIASAVASSAITHLGGTSAAARIGRA
jgi:NAD(P)-dependent dehydrogenase (short-subunit alcohol dehydrogenase family)